MSYAATPNPSRRAAVLTSVAVLHASAFYLLVTGLAGVVTMIEPPRHLQASNEPIFPITPPTRPIKPRTIPRNIVRTDADTKIDPIPLPPLPLPSPTAEPAGGLLPFSSGDGDVRPTPTPTPRYSPRPAMPRGAPGAWITTDDYPAQDLREENAGTTGFRLTIDADGHVQGCAITRSSGHPGLDAATCRLVSHRAAFKPATDSNGAAITGSYQSQVRWIIPQL